MSVSDDYAAIVARLRGWGFKVTEWSGCYGRSNGGGWSAGRPVGHINHHYVCSLNPDQGYINGLVNSLANGTTVQWFADVHGVAYLIGTGPMNHAGTGNSSVLNKTKADQPPASNPAGSSGDIGGNSHYAGTECQHPGDSTPWPAPMLDVMVAINAAEFLQWGYSANRAINHSEWSNRKIDMSAGGGVNSDGWSAAELRKRVAAQMGGGGGPGIPPVPPSEDEDMARVFYIQSTDGTVWFTSDFVTRRKVPGGSQAMNRLKDAIWNSLNVKLPDGKPSAELFVLNGSWLKFTSTDQIPAKEKGQASLDQFGVPV
jgi:hypothetical protein